MNLRKNNKRAPSDIAVMVTATRVLSYRLRYAALALVAASMAAFVTLGIDAVLAAPPANDSLASATSVSPPASQFVTTTEATLQAGEQQPCSIGKTVWYRHQAAAGEKIIVDTEGSNFDTAIAVYSSASYTTSFANLLHMGCDNDSGTGNLSKRTIFATAGTWYYIQAGGYNGASGNLQVNLAIENNNLADAVGIPDVAYSQPIYTIGATLEAGEPTPCSQTGATVWFKFTASRDQILAADTLLSSHDTQLAIFSGPSSNPTFASLTLMDCKLDSGSSDDARITFAAQAGTTYYLQAGGWGGQIGTLHFDLKLENDDLEFAKPAAPLPYSNAQNMIGSSTQDADWEWYQCPLTNNTVWYRYDATFNTKLVADAAGNDFDPMLAVYEGPPGGATFYDLYGVDCNDDIEYPLNTNSRVVFNATAGQTYYFQVGSWIPAGNLVFSLQTAAAIITVDSTGDGNTPDSVVTLREAILLANGGVGGNGTTTGLGRAPEEEESDNLSGALLGAGSADTINFSDPPFPAGNPGVINLSSSLPYLTGGNDTIDGLGRGVRIDGAGEPSAFSCITIDSALNTIKGLQLTDCTNGVWVVPDANANVIGPGNTLYDNQNGIGIGGNGNTIKGNSIGVTVDGTNVHPDGGNSRGIEITGDNNVIGGISGTSPGVACTGACNIISGNSVGIELQLFAMWTVIQGNYIGTDVTGTLDRGNLGEGVLIRGDSNKVGGYELGEGNLISGNGGDGINIFGSDATGNGVSGNYIGTDAAGTTAIPNGNGVHIQGGSGNHIGVVGLGGGNVISGNYNMGVRIAGPGNFVQANRIGTTASATAPLGNGNQGVRVENAANNKIAWNIIADNEIGIYVVGTTSGTAIESNFIGTNASGTVDLGNSVAGVYLDSNSTTVGGLPEDGNAIAFTKGDGIYVGGTTGHLIANNFIHDNLGRGVGIWGGSGHKIDRNIIRDNGLLAIDIAALPEDPFGVTANDGALDMDSGPNNVQNYPVINLIDLDTVSNIQGTLDSAPNTTFTLQFYYGSFCDSSGHGEGSNFLVQGSVNTDGNGHGVFKVFFSTPPEFFIPSQFVTATATDPAGNTSEFSLCKAVWDDADDDNDGFTDDAEALTIGTNAGYPCGFGGWPADLWDQPPLSANKITVQDLTSFLAPARRLGTSPGDGNFNPRWDIVPGAGLFSATINVQDMTKLVTLAPPMLNGARALNGPACPMPSQ